LYTVEEFLELDLFDDEENIYELIEGKIVARPKSGVSAKHGRVAQIVGHYLEQFAGLGAGDKLQGQVFQGASTNLGRTDSGSYLIPDVCFVKNGRLPDDFEGAIPLVPDIIIEVNSPSDTTEKIHAKLEAYRKVNVPLVWSIYLLEKFLVIYRGNDPDIKFVNINGELDGADILPGFKLAMRQLFEEKT
jgi:Uma2 family endonuclease